MNQTKKHTTGKKLLALLLALIMTVSLLPMSVFAAEPGAEETPVVEGQTQPAAETGADDAEQAQEPDADEADEGEEDAVLPGDAEGDADDADVADDGIAAFAADGVAVQADVELKNRIVHLDCGRKYFSVDYIKAVLKTMAENGFNQLELAFGNGGLRFVLDEMDIKSGNSTLHNSDDVKAAILEGNKNFYDDPNGNALTETDMKAIITYANKVDVEIVPLLNMPGHMDGILSSKLFSQYQLSGSAESLDLNNPYAIGFSLALLKLYVDWFKTYGNSNYFNFGADEYGQGIQNPYIGTNKANVTYTKLIRYMNDCADVIESQEMVARCFNDFVCYQGNTDCDLYKTVQVCYWSNQWGNNQYYTTPDTIKNAGYKMINTNQKWYFVPSKADEYGKSVVLSNFSTFDVTKYQNIRNGYNSNSTTYTEIPVGKTNVGAMFCVWCDKPSVDVALSDVQELIAAMATANPSYFTKKTVPEEPETPVIKQDDTTVSGSKVQVAMGATTTLTLSGNKTATWSSSDEKILKLEAVSSKTRAAVAGTNAVQVVPVATGTATVTAKLDDGAELSTKVTVTAAPEPTTVNVELKVGDTSQVYEGAADAKITTAGNNKVATANLVPFKQDGNTKRTLGTKISAGEGVIYDGNGYYIKIVNGSIQSTESIDEATVFTVTHFVKYQGNTPITYYNIQVKGGTSTQFLNLHKANDYYYYTLELGESYDWRYDSSYGYYGNNRCLACFNGNWLVTSSTVGYNYGRLYTFTTDTIPGKDVSNITFTGVKAGTTTYVIGGVTYVVTVKAKEVPVTLEVDDSVTFDVGTDKISESPNTDIATAVISNGILTLTGVKASDKTTYCTVGDTRYVITVVEKSTETGTPLYVDFWVTNYGFMPDDLDDNVTIVKGGTGSGNRRVTAKYAASMFAGSEGRLLSEVLPQTGSDVVNRKPGLYWKTRYLPLATRQTTAGWTNKSGYGTDVLSGEAGGKDIERIRYYGGKWSYLPVDGTEWIDFNTSTSNKVTLEETGAQIAAYYMLKTTVTKEVTTYITDWPDPHKTSDAIYGVALDYCVKYLGDNVTRYPSEFGNANENTHWFNCKGEKPSDAYTNGYTVASTDEAAANWTGLGTSKWYRVINNIEAVDTDQYEVYMITATPGDQFTGGVKGYTQCPDTITYPATGEKVIWAIDDQAVTDSGLDKHAELVVGGAPRVDRVVIQQCTGLLLTYYVRAKAKVDNLHVYYIDDTTGLGIFDYDIIPHATNTPNDFSGFDWDQTNYSRGFTKGGFVINNQGNSVTVQTDLKKLSGIAGKYQAGYTLVRIERSEDNRTLKLYYTLNGSYAYVVDFGVPAKVRRIAETVEFTKIAVGNTELFANGTTTGAAANATNGKLYVGSDNELYYQLTTMQYTNPDVFNVTYTYADNTSNTYTVTFIPASNVYYEDDDAFITFAGGQGKADAAQWKVELDKGKTAADESKQIAEVLSKAKNVYGTDPTYENSTMFSLGRAHKVTVSADMVNNWNENSDAWPTAQFTFKGTGFDVISLTNDKSGLLTYKIEKQDGNGNWTTEKQQFVINYYDYGYDAEKGWTKDTRDTLYQLPVIKADGLAYGTYRVTLTVAYGAIFDKTGENKYSIWLDGVRIYDPAGPDLNQTYAKDGEGWAQYIELRDKLAEQKDQRTALFIEDNSNSASIEDYKNYGPNHEVYLLNKQAIAFQLGNIDKVAKVQIGAKAPMGSATLTVNGMEVKPLETATEMYYDITAAAKSGTVIITNGSTENSSILSLTQLKITYKENPSTSSGAELSILTAKQQQEVVQMVRAMYAPAPEPDPEPFAPERFEASWNRRTVKVGQKATLTVKTSEDVEAITVDGVTIDTYRTRTQRTGWGWNAKRVTYREFTYTITAKEAGTLNCSVTAFNAENTASEPITAALTVQAAAQRPSWGGWLGNLFGRWF